MNSAKDNYMMKTFSGRMILATIAALVLSVAFGGSALGQGSIERASERVNTAESKIAAREAQARTQSNQASPLAPDAANNYVFATTTGGTFTDMSSGTTQLVAAGQDDIASVVTNIGFDFYLLGVRYTQFSASSNGFVRLGGTAVSTTQYTLGTAGPTLIAAYGSDLFTSTTGKVHFKVTGSAPNRVLTVEFFNETIIFDGAGATADGTYQIRLYETTGVVEFVYGQMNRNASTGFLGGMDPQYVGFSTAATNNTYVTVTTATNTANTTGAPASNQPPLSTPIANLNTPVDGSRRTYSFTPATPTAPTGLNFTGVTPLAMTLNWTDSPDESLYAVYRSTDGVNYTFETTLAQNSTSYAASGLTPSTLYFWRVFAISDGAFSTALSGSQATSAAGSISSTVAGGNWSSTATWVGGVIPTATDNVTIVSGATVTVDSSNALNVTVQSGGILQFEQATARTLTVGQSVTIDSGGTFQSNPAGTQTGHILSVGTDLINNGTLDFSTNANTAGAGITFTGAANNTFGGSGGTTDIRTLTTNKGTSNANILELNPTNFTVQGTSVDGAPMAFLTLTNGTLKVSGTFTMSGRVFTAAAYTIAATAGFWLNNPNFTVVGQPGSPTESGLLRISQGTFNIGTGTGNSMGFSSGSTITIEGGAVNATGRFGVNAAGNTITYTQTAGTITVCTIGNASATLSSFDLGTSLSSSITMTGGTIIVQIGATGTTVRDYRNQAGAGIAGVTGGALQMGNASSGAAKAFLIYGVVPNLVINNASAGHSVTWAAPVNYNNISLDITINTGNTLNFGNNVFLFNGTTLTNNGTFTHNGASSRFIWFRPATANSYTGSGTVTAPMTSFELQDDIGVTINPASPNIVVARIILFTGGITNANKLTLGNGGATSGIVQIGNTTTPTNAGTFDVAPTFNLGTGGETLSYLRTTASRNTGPEINPARTLTTFTYDDNDVTHSLTLTGGDLTVTGATGLTNGHVITGANTQIVGSAGTVTRTTGLVDGNFRKTFAAVGSKTFEVGTANGYSPVTVNVTAGTFPADIIFKAVQGPQPNVATPGAALQRYWTGTAGPGLTVDITFNYLAADVLAPTSESNLKVFIYDGAFTNLGGTVNTVSHSATITGIDTESGGTADFTLAEPNAPTAAPATISGRVTTADGTPLGGATIFLSGNASARTITNGDGQYRFDNVPTEAFYTVTPALVNYSFSPSSRSFSLMGNQTDVGFTANATAATGNPLNVVDYFVRQQYLDFLGREPDMGGWLYWTSQINACGNNQLCINQRRIDVSAAFFASEEFQQTGSFIYRLYQTGLGRQLSYGEFTADRPRVLAGPDLEENRAAFALEFVTRPEFTMKYQNATSADAFVDSLLATVLQSSGLDLSAQRDALIAEYSQGANLNHSRSRVLRTLADNSAITDAAYNPSFVLMEYYGYLRRDIDQGGYEYWLDVLNNGAAGNYRGMVCAFLTSTEYQLRFSPIVTHSNAECGQ